MIKGFLPIGGMAAGKDTFAHICMRRFPDFFRGEVALADNLKAIRNALAPHYGDAFQRYFEYRDGPDAAFGLSDVSDMYEYFKTEDGKRFMRNIDQQLGTQLGRKYFGPKCWIHSLETTNPDIKVNPYVIKDVRFDNELDHFSGKGYEYTPVLISVDEDIHVKRYCDLYSLTPKDYYKADAHECQWMTTRILKNPGKMILIRNNGSLEEFEDKIVHLVRTLM